jgi:cellulose synthase/poly-beta-1,6-N-acetylglucosamine synthase-like glycosyltransferase
MVNFIDVFFIAGDTLFLFIVMVYFLVFLESGNKKILKKRQFLPKVSVVIPAWNEEKTIARTLESVFAQNYPKNKMEIIVVDDGSNDNTGKIAKSYAGVKVIRREKNYEKNELKAGALNAGFKAAKNKIIVAIDADCRLDKNAIKNAVQEMRDPKVGAVTGSVIVENPKTIVQYLQYIDYINMDFYRKMQNILGGVFCIPGALGVFRKNIVEKLGGFTPGHLTEDMEMTYKLHAGGHVIKTAKNAFSYTGAPETLTGLIKQRLRWYRGSLQLIMKYRWMLFNRKLSNYGMFVLPTNYLPLFLVLGFDFLILKTYLKQIFNWVVNFMAWNNSGLQPFLSIDLNYSFFLLRDIKLVFLVVSFTIFFFILFIGFKFTEEKMSAKKLLALIPYSLIYGLILAWAWILAGYHELAKKKESWNRIKSA